MSIRVVSFDPGGRTGVCMAQFHGSAGITPPLGVFNLPNQTSSCQFCAGWSYSGWSIDTAENPTFENAWEDFHHTLNHCFYECPRFTTLYVLYEQVKVTRPQADATGIEVIGAIRLMTDLARSELALNYPQEPPQVRLVQRWPSQLKGPRSWGVSPENPAAFDKHSLDAFYHWLGFIGLPYYNGQERPLP